MADFRIRFYDNLATLLSAGLPILRALKTSRNQARGRWKKTLAKIEQDLTSGTELSASMSRFPRRFQNIDIALVQVGERTGQLAEILHSLSQWYELRKRLKQVVLKGLAYPLFIFHFACFILPIPFIALGDGDWTAYPKRLAALLSILYVPLFCFLILRAIFPRHGIIRRMADTVFLSFPVAGTAVRYLAIGRYCSTFSIMYKAGIPIMECARLATLACGNEVMKLRLEGGHQAARRGSPMSEGFGRGFDPEFLELWAIGEESGNLDKTTEKLGQMYIEKAQFRFEMLASWLPKLVYFALMITMAFLIIKIASQIYGNLPTNF